MDYYADRPEFHIRSLVPSIHISGGDYTLARLALTQLQPSSTIESEYKEVQHIYLDYLESGLGPVSSHAVNRLSQIGSKEGAINGYARSVYYLVTGLKLPLSFPGMNVESRERKSSAQSSPRTISCFPNPTQSEFRVEISEEQDVQYVYSLLDMQGNLLVEESIRSNNSLIQNVDKILPGIYLVQIRGLDKNLIHSEKIVILD